MTARIREASLATIAVLLVVAGAAALWLAPTALRSWGETWPPSGLGGLGASGGVARAGGGVVTVPPEGPTDLLLTDAGREGVLDVPVPPTRTGLPAIDKLDPALFDALVQAGIVAASDGIHLEVTSGWRSPAYQQRLFDEAVARYGGVDEARRWVSPPAVSTHVTGDAVDIGPLDAQLWLARRGSTWGLCQTYANERWHFELGTTPGGSCPPQRTDAAG